MRDVRTLLILGIWVALLPYLGFPIFWKNILLSASGVALIFISYVYYRDSKKSESVSFENFSENSDFSGNDSI